MDKKHDHTIFKTDWLASTPVFYNEHTLKVSHNINDVIDWENIQFHPEGLYNYLLFGYSVMEQTPIKDVKFLPPNAEISIKDNKIEIIRHDDECINLLNGPETNEEDVIGQIRQSINNWAADKENIIVPTSGGYDSRLLNALVADKDKLHAFSYGASSRHPESVKAAYICHKLGISWKYIELGKFHQYINDWNNLFGPSTHAHGMYQMEFYQQIKDMGYQQMPLLSGIVGDAWAGSIQVTPINTVDDIKKLGYTHGMNADPTQLLLETDDEIAHTYLNGKYETLKHPSMRVVETIRFKIILLNYLMTVPREMGFKPWSPFLDQNIAMAMMKLPAERRKNRIWQKELFEHMGVDAEKSHLKTSRKGHINLHALRTVPLQPLHTELLAEIINPQYVQWINRELQKSSAWSHLYDDCMHTPYLKEILKKCGFSDTRMQAYCAYLTLKPIEEVIIKRNRTQKES